MMHGTSALLINDRRLDVNGIKDAVASLYEPGSATINNLYIDHLTAYVSTNWFARDMKNFSRATRSEGAVYSYLNIGERVVTSGVPNFSESDQIEGKSASWLFLATITIGRALAGNHTFPGINWDGLFQSLPNERYRTRIPSGETGKYLGAVTEGLLRPKGFQYIKTSAPKEVVVETLQAIQQTAKEIEYSSWDVRVGHPTNFVNAAISLASSAFYYATAGGREELAILPKLIQTPWTNNLDPSPHNLLDWKKDVIPALQHSAIKFFR